jgi:hypothetical protein
LDYAPADRNASPRSVWRFVLISCLGLALYSAVVAAMYPLAALVPWGWRVSADVAVPHWKAGKPPFEVHAFGRGYGPFVRFEQGGITRRSDDGPEDWRSSMGVNYERLTYQESPDEPHAPLTRESMLDFVSQGQEPPVDPGAAAVADRLIEELRRLGAGKLPREPKANYGYHTFDSVYYEMSAWRLGSGRFYFDQRGAWVPWYAPWCVPVWLVAWWRVRRRALHRCAAI